MTKTGTDNVGSTNNAPKIKLLDFLRAVATTQPSAENPNGSTIKTLMAAILPHYPKVTPTDIMHIRAEAMPIDKSTRPGEEMRIDKSKQLVEKTGYHHSLTDLGKQMLADLEAVEAAAKDTTQESVEA